MPVERYLGGAWASVHGPHDPRRLLLWLLENEFRGLLPEPGPRATDWSAVMASAEDLPVDFAAVRASGVLTDRPLTAALASAKDAEQRTACAVIADQVRLARTLGCPTILLEPGLVPILGETVNEDLGDASAAWTLEKASPMLARRKTGLNGALDRACRMLFELCRTFPDIRFCLTTGRNILTVADRRGLEAIFEDLSNLKLAYWHDTAVVARREQVLGEPQGEWLESFSNRLAGYTLGDAGPDGLYQVPGAGGVDWTLLASYLLRSGKPIPAVLELDPSVDPGEMPGIRSFLDKFGL